MGKKKRKIRICPKCKTPSLRPASYVSGWLTPDKFRCMECGYVGHIYLEVEPEEYQTYLEEHGEEVGENNGKGIQ